MGQRPTLPTGSIGDLQQMSRDELLTQHSLQTGALQSLSGLQQVGVTAKNVDIIVAGCSRVLAGCEQIIAYRVSRDPSGWPEWARREFPKSKEESTR